jgi:hypothetical protein
MDNVIDITAAPLPKWQDAAPCVAAQQRSKNAADAAASSARDLDRANAALIAADAEVADAQNAKAADRAEAARDAAVQQIAAAQKAIERASRELAWAEKATAEAEAEAKRECAVAHKKIYNQRVLSLMRRVVDLTAEAKELKAVAASIAQQFPHASTRSTASGFTSSGAYGLVDASIGVNFNNPPILAAAGRLDQVFGRRFEKLDAWLALCRDVLGYKA